MVVARSAESVVRAFALEHQRPVERGVVMELQRRRHRMGTYVRYDG